MFSVEPAQCSLGEMIAVERALKQKQIAILLGNSG